MTKDREKLLNRFCAKAEETDHAKADGEQVGILGLIGEVGELVTILKKKERQDVEFDQMNSTASEELGDCFWYVAKICREYGIGMGDLLSNKSLDARKAAGSSGKEISECLTISEQIGVLLRHKGDSKIRQDALAEICLSLCYLSEMENRSLCGVLKENLDKTEARYGDTNSPSPLSDCDMGFPCWQQLPETLEIRFEKTTGGRVAIIIDNRRYGDLLTDNSNCDDGFKFHDVFHFGFCAILSWSPVTRSLLKAKRKDCPHKDEVEDGARAIIIEEGIVHLAFKYGLSHCFSFEKDQRIDTSLLKTISFMVRGYEVEAVEMKLWEKAIKDSCCVLKELIDKGEGTIRTCRRTKTIKFIA
ncbi:MAG: hypothetical protein ACPGGG_03380 [Parvibaculales bacterium]